LKEALEGLDSALKTFEAAAAINNDLEQAVGNPDGRTALRSKVGDFESAWVRKRGTLTENMQEVKTRLSDIIAGWDQWDTETAAEFENASTSTQTVTPTGVV